MKETKHKQLAQDVPPKDAAVARQLAKGFTLVPCWVSTEDGRRVHSCKWVKIVPARRENVI